MAFAAVLNYELGKVQIIEYDYEKIQNENNGDVEEYLTEHHNYNNNNMYWMAIEKIDIEIINL